MEHALRYIWAIFTAVLAMVFVVLYGLVYVIEVLIAFSFIVLCSVGSVIGGAAKWITCHIYQYIGPKVNEGEDLRNPLSKFSHWLLSKDLLQ